jgi:hypothetical protein
MNEDVEVVDTNDAQEEAKQEFFDAPAPAAFRTSEEVDKICAALAAVYGEIEAAEMDKQGNFGKYASRASLDKASRAVCAKHGLFLIHTIRKSIELGRLVLTTRSWHQSGQWIESDVIYCEPQRDASQGHGAALTYAIRQGTGAHLNMSAEEDSDGEDPTAQNGRTRSTEPKDYAPLDKGRRRSTAPAPVIDQDDTPEKRVAATTSRKPCPICKKQIKSQQEIAYRPATKRAAHWKCYVEQLAADGEVPPEEDADFEDVEETTEETAPEPEPVKKKSTSRKKKTSAKKKTTSKRDDEPEPDDDLPF